MLYFYRIEVSERIDVNKTSASNEGHISHYWYFLNKGFKFQTQVYTEVSSFCIMIMMSCY